VRRKRQFPIDFAKIARFLGFGETIARFSRRSCFLSLPLPDVPLAMLGIRGQR
jgi:hypothetical protein